MPPLSVNLGGKKKFTRIVLNLPGVQRRVTQVTRQLEGESRARLAKHRKSGDHGIEVIHDRHTRIITLFSRTTQGAPMSIQFGHFSWGKWVEGLKILPTSKGDGG
jgi:hypothetical protein